MCLYLLVFRDVLVVKVEIFVYNCVRRHTGFRRIQAIEANEETSGAGCPSERIEAVVWRSGEKWTPRTASE